MPPLPARQVEHRPARHGRRPAQHPFGR
jgi:hypothetical protein